MGMVGKVASGEGHRDGTLCSGSCEAEPKRQDRRLAVISVEIEGPRISLEGTSDQP